ncbi:CBS domain-containing protein [Thermincola ferriacetica]
MLVKDLMAQPVVLITEKATVGEALELIRQHDVRHLPVVDRKQHLVGVTSESDLLKIFPRNKHDERKTFETNLLLRTPITQVMIPDPYHINPHITIEEAALLMKNHKIGCLPVIEHSKVIGLISRTDVIEAFINSLGLGKSGVRVTIPYRKKIGFLSDLVRLADKFGVLIDHMVTFETEIVLKIRREKAEQFLKELKSHGYTVTDITCIENSVSLPCA